MFFQNVFEIFSNSPQHFTKVKRKFLQIFHDFLKNRRKIFTNVSLPRTATKIFLKLEENFIQVPSNFLKLRRTLFLNKYLHNFFVLSLKIAH